MYRLGEQVVIDCPIKLSDTRWTNCRDSEARQMGSSMSQTCLEWELTIPRMWSSGINRFGWKLFQLLGDVWDWACEMSIRNQGKTLFPWANLVKVIYYFTFSLVYRLHQFHRITSIGPACFKHSNSSYLCVLPSQNQWPLSNIAWQLMFVLHWS